MLDLQAGRGSQMAPAEQEICPLFAEKAGLTAVIGGRPGARKVLVPRPGLVVGGPPTGDNVSSFRRIVCVYASR